MVNDSFFKLCFSHRGIVADFLRGFVPEPWVEGLDLTTLQLEETRRVTAELRQRESDRLWSVESRRKGRPRVFLHVEFQSEADSLMALRMVTCQVGLYNGLLAEKRINGSALPLVHSCMIYSGDGAWGPARDLGGLVCPPAEGARRLPSMTYELVASGEVDVNRPELAVNSAAALLRFSWNRDPQRAWALATDVATSLRRVEPGRSSGDSRNGESTSGTRRSRRASTRDGGRPGRRRWRTSGAC